MSVFMIILLSILYFIIGVFFAGIMCSDGSDFDFMCFLTILIWPMIAILLICLWTCFPIFKLGKKLGERYSTLEDKFTNWMGD